VRSLSFGFPKARTGDCQDEDDSRVCFLAYGAAPCLRCGGRFSRHTYSAECAARCGAVGQKPNRLDMCLRWAAAGECAKNPEYMVGTRASPGSCRKSCNTCRV
jgi:prolyl 4-hydroxylase